MKIQLSCILNRVSTSSDGGWKLVFDCSEQDTDSILELCRHKERLLIVNIEPEHAGIENHEVYDG